METPVKVRAVHRTKPELIAHELRALIIGGQYLPGQRLILRELASEFACSEIPVREALNVLVSQGLVVNIPHEGARVSDINLGELIEFTELRLCLEQIATVKAAPHIPPVALTALRGILAQMEERLAARDTDAYGELNSEFHDKLLDHCPNSKMVAMIRTLRDQTERGRAVHRLQPTHSGKSLKFHKRMIRAISTQRLDELSAVIEEHNSNVLKVMQATLALDPTPESKRAAS